MAGRCTGLTVLDFSLGMPGAICTLVMADYGAEVIKVEPPGGDPFRFQPAWISWNRGKKGIVLDLSTTEGREQAIQLAGEADVLVESFRPGTWLTGGWRMTPCRNCTRGWSTAPSRALGNRARSAGSKGTRASSRPRQAGC